MQIFNRRYMQGLVIAVIALLSAVASTGAVHAQDPVFRNPEVALKQGIGAYRGGYYEIAIPALEFAADEDILLAKYYLAQIYSDNLGSKTDHVRAFRLYRAIVDEHSDIDPDVDPRAPIVGQSLTAYARYILNGLSEIDLQANPERARAFFNNASMTFNNEDAQFELAKMSLAGDGGARDRQMARHWLSTLTRRGHSGAQAFLADLLWRGKHMEADPVRALALIAVAVKNAPPEERLWIEDIYQTIYCGAPDGVRGQATGIVAEWGQRYGRKARARIGKRAMQGGGGPLRTCQNGEAVGSVWKSDVIAAPREDTTLDRKVPLAQPDGMRQGRTPRPRFSLGGAVGKPGPAPRPALGLRDVTTPAPTR